VSHENEADDSIDRAPDARKRLGFKSTPQIILLNRDGTKLREWTGMVSEADLASGLGELIAASRPK
jgi:hypothetical protein